jgi:hypothetical protein
MTEKYKMNILNSVKDDKLNGFFILTDEDAVILKFESRSLLFQVKGYKLDILPVVAKPKGE